VRSMSQPRLDRTGYSPMEISWNARDVFIGNGGMVPKLEGHLTPIIHESFCCNRRSAATTSLRPAGSPFGPSPYCWGLAPFSLAPVPV